MTRTSTPNQESSRRAPGEQKPSDSKDADWGFSKRKDERVLEPRLGAALVFFLLLMFAFVLYQKYDAIKKAGHFAVAEQMKSDELGVISPSLSEGEDDALDSPTDLRAATETKDSLFDPIDESGGAGQRSNPVPSLVESSPEMVSSAAHEGDSNPFVRASQPETNDWETAGPPSQDDPDPFSTTDSPIPPPPSQDGDMNAELVFVEEAPVSDQNAEHLGQSVADHTPPNAPGMWDLESAPAPPSEEPDPFAAATEDSGSGFDEEKSSGWTLNEHEPQTLEAPEIAMPLKTPAPEPNPFGQAEPLPEGPALAQEPDPFGDSEPADGDELSSIEESNEALPGSKATEFKTSDQRADVPELPALAGPSPTSEDLWELNSPPETPRATRPATSTSPQTTGTATAAGPLTEAREFMSRSATGESVVGERTVTVSRNDSLWSIAQDAYGSARYLPALAQYNRDVIPHPDKLALGLQLRIPPPEVLERQYPDLFRRQALRDGMVAPAGNTMPSSESAQPGLYIDSQGRPQYRVDKSDTLSGIAQRYLGRGSRWTEILALNRDQLQTPESLKPGMILDLPGDASRISVLSDQPFSR